MLHGKLKLRIPKTIPTNLLLQHHYRFPGLICCVLVSWDDKINAHYWSWFILCNRSLLPLSFSSKGKPPRSFVTTISSSGLFVSQKLGKSNAPRSQHQPKCVKPLQTVPDDDSPVTCIKTSSPNGKRISSPNCDVGSSPTTRRGGRKLILQSISSFPSLTPHH